MYNTSKWNILEGTMEKTGVLYVCLKCGRIICSYDESCKCGWCESQEKAKTNFDEIALINAYKTHTDKEFCRRLQERYAFNSPVFDKELFDKREDEEYAMELADRAAVEQIHKEIQEAESNEVRCPKCGSASITTGLKWFSLLTGFLGSNKTVNRCASCGYSWKPGR